MVYDVYGRPLLDLRMSVTDRCNFRCTYCMPDIEGKQYCFMKREQLMTFEEMERLARLFVQLGVRKIRLTGGEPLLRKNIDVLVATLTNIEGVQDVALTTNGFFLKKYAKKLKDAGMKRVNVSLDALDNTIFTKMNGVGVRSEHILEGIDAALAEGLHVKVNMVVKKGLNDHEILPMAYFFKKKGITLRFIEFMDVGSLNGWKLDDVVTSKQIYDMISEHMPLEPVAPAHVGEVAKRYRYVGTDVEVGFISSVSAAFCSDCTRGRLSADGRLYTCLFAINGTDLLSMMRAGASDEQLLTCIEHVWRKRADRYSEERGKQTAWNGKRIEMSYIGG
ncbi:MULTISPECIES: GTP 3',8-cyclase MoaA [Anoxybacillus]|uniref:GTP 3',8-cyclase n=1 Tax=Anoxybacillus flavithermus TaxID=33934 RepID=A0AAX2A2J6_9BACL|nr:GTP 3',8-cyclase MoaA [Anoxybacillus flavithermus]MBE2908040.1 GTP 3',8-cyclase MoaA [Anoxybacillus flavithermus]MBE2910812.1 GTP 3',8-cyclase MoaA [Anoxybacillus flavithermus]MBE2913633.1 GTP 3',8-cyclase MoaA [Anoxybacillus flavithermus]MBE2915995.1 GTP 3',8-cyclase MoaA [Anoxybacillus flavithermus]MBE2919165.1 GTP 3',8-cyclase MoaA [Anoxybacillus flavithermus]